MATHVFLAAVVVAIVVCSCCTTTTAAAATSARIKVSTGMKAKHGWMFVDGDGRARLFHGVNAVYKARPDLCVCVCRGTSY
jgi:hypothetical protein